jgi:HEAT repeat-containing protein 5
MIHSQCQTQHSDMDYQLHEPPPPATLVVDTVIELFARLLPLQGLTSTTEIIKQILESVRSPMLEKNAGRRSAVFINATITLVLALRNATVSRFRQARDTFGNAQVTSLLSPFLIKKNWFVCYPRTSPLSSFVD